MIVINMYAGSFDPITIGHEWIIKHAPGNLIVVIATNPVKKYHFTAEERCNLVCQSINAIVPRAGGYTEVAILNKDEYLVNYAHARGVGYLIRGARSVTDFEYEQAYSDVNRLIDPDLYHLMMMPPLNLRSASSSLVKSLVGPTGWEKVVGQYVSPHVVEALRGTQERV